VCNGTISRKKCGANTAFLFIGQRKRLLFVAALQGEKLKYQGKLYSASYATREERATALLHLCDEMEELMPAVVEMGGYVPFSPGAAVKTRLAILQEAMDTNLR
jgi:hypothetical protein